MKYQSVIPTSINFGNYLRKFCRIFVIILFIVLVYIGGGLLDRCCFYSFQPLMHNGPVQIINYQGQRSSTPRDLSKPASIVFWNRPYGSFPLDRLHCPTGSRTYYCDRTDIVSKDTLRSADSVVFSPVFQLPRQWFKRYQLNFLLSNTSPNVTFAFMQPETPAMYPPAKRTGWFVEYFHRDLTPYDGLINETLTYRRDSTIPKFFGTGADTFKKLRSSLGFDLEQRRSRSRGVLSLVSNCRSQQRNNLIAELSELLRWPNGTRALELYGACADIIKPKIDTPNPKAMSRTDNHRHYRFYLAFENSLCEDYVSEKFFDQALAHGMVPIVSGARRESYEKFLPGDSFIHVDDFKTTRELAEHVNRLLVNDNEYIKYFRWYRMSLEEIEKRENPTGEQWGLCGLCMKAHMIREGKSTHRMAIPDLQTWWYGDRYTISDKICHSKVNF